MSIHPAACRSTRRAELAPLPVPAASAPDPRRAEQARIYDPHMPIQSAALDPPPDPDQNRTSPHTPISLVRRSAVRRFAVRPARSRSMCLYTAASLKSLVTWYSTPAL